MGGGALRVLRRTTEPEPSPVATVETLAEIVQRVNKLVWAIHANAGEEKSKEVLLTLLGPDGYLGKDPREVIKVVKQTGIGLAVGGLAREYSGMPNDVRTLAAEVKQHVWGRCIAEPWRVRCVLAPLWRQRLRIAEQAGRTAYEVEAAHSEASEATSTVRLC